MRKNLSPQFVASAKAEPGAERSIFWDETLPGFGLMVTKAGAKSYVCQYRAGARSRRMSLKTALKLGEARKEARAILGKVAKGGDPLSEQRKADAATGNTLKAVCENYFAREGKKLRTVDERQSQLARLVYPKLGARQIEDIRRSEIVKLSTISKTRVAPSWRTGALPICAASFPGMPRVLMISGARLPEAWRELNRVSWPATAF